MPPETAISSAAAAASWGRVKVTRFEARGANGVTRPAGAPASMRAAMPAHRSACGGRAAAAAARATTRFKSLSTAVHSAQSRRCASTAVRSLSDSSPSR
jgi:hypothetical protein